MKWRIAVAIVVLVLCVLRLREGTANLVDDALITLRHARFVALGEGITYNRGEPVLGTTTPLYALVHGGVGAVIGPERIPWSSVIGNTIADVLALFLIVAWVRELGLSRATALAAAALYAFAPRAIEYSSGGMEAPVFTLLVLVGLREASKGHEIAAGVASGLALVCRPDGGLVGLVTLAWLAYRRRGVPWRFVLAGLLTVAPWFLWATATYPWGPLPQSVVAKSHRPWVRRPWHATLLLGYQLAAQGLGRTALLIGLRGLRDAFALPGIVYHAGLGLFALAHAALFLSGAKRIGASGVLLVVFGAAYAFTYAAGNPTMFGWYLVPLEAVYAILLATGVGTLVEGRRGRLLLAALVALQLFTAIVLRDHRSAVALGERWDKVRERAYYDLADRLRGKVPEGATIQVSENGVFGWAWPGRVIDTVGLVTPGCEPFYPLPEDKLVNDMAVPAPLVLHFRPEVFISLETFIRKTCLEDRAFLDAYELDTHASDPSCTVFGSRGMLVFRRRETRGR